MEFNRRFNELGKNDAGIAGGKGASLGEMTQVGIPVPSGFVILSSAFERFLEETDLNTEIDTVLHTVNKEEMHTVEYASEKIQGLILAAKMPEDIATEIKKHFKELDAEFVAVRSSATAEDSASAAWAGQLDSFLNTNEAELLTNVQRCWASLFTPRAIFYRFEKDLHLTKISVAVVVQKMVASEYSGIAFSVHPVTEDRNQLIIEAGFGLGEAIVSGQVTPDSYVVEKEPRRIIDTNISIQTRALYRAGNGGNEWKEISEPQASSQVLTEKQILELSEIIIRIENHYGFPCDIEWAFENGKFYIVQSRPITTLTQGDSKKAIAVNSYVGEVDLSNDRQLERLFTREYSVFAFYHWVEDIMKHITKWADIKDMLILSEGDDNARAGVFYLNKDLVSCFSNLQKLINTTDYFEQQEKHFKKTLAPVFPAKEELEKNPTVRNLKKFVEVFLAWYMENVSVMHSVVDLEGIDEEKRKRALQYREQTQELDASLSSIIFKTLMKLYPEHEDVIWYLLPNEINLLENGLSREQKNEILRRKNEGWFFLNGKFFVGKQNLENELGGVGLTIKKDNNEIKLHEIKGTTAYGGTVTGKVKIIKSTKELHVFNEGEILVCAMSNPEYLPFIKKAAAMITDEGGLTCHAAIVARELKKPCVIGTKIATQVLKDGDMVEVDADNGVVGILERGDRKKILTNIFSREKTLYYFDLWNQCDFDGPKKFFGRSLSPVLFMVFPKGKKGSVWCAEQDMEDLRKAALDILSGENGMSIFEHMQNEIEIARKYLVPFGEGRDITTLEELKKYQQELLRYWQTMNSAIWFIIDDEKLPKNMRDYFIGVREETEKYSERWSILPTDFFSKNYPQYKDLVSVITFNEMISLAEDCIDDGTLKEIRKRKTGCFLVDGKVYDGVDKVDSFLSKHNMEREKITDETIRELSGSVGFPGKVSGRVKIIDGYQDLEKIQPGDILVTQMTNPKYVPVIKIVAALVTDEGGALCHAAIVAREMKKPCVIGTKIATQVLKDGDIVEVDADNGTVKIII